MIPEIAYITPVAILSIRLACIVLLTSFFRNQFNHTVKGKTHEEQYQGEWPKNIVIDRTHDGISDSHGQNRGEGGSWCSERGWYHCRVSDHHLDSQGFPEGTRHTKDNRCKDSRAGCLERDMPNGLPACRTHGHTSLPVMTGHSSEAIGRHKGDSWSGSNKEDKDPWENPKTSPSKETTRKWDDHLKANESVNNWRNPHQSSMAGCKKRAPLGRLLSWKLLHQWQTALPRGQKARLQ